MRVAAKLLRRVVVALTLVVTTAASPLQWMSPPRSPGNLQEPPSDDAPLHRSFQWTRTLFTPATVTIPRKKAINIYKRFCPLFKWKVGGCGKGGTPTTTVRWCKYDHFLRRLAPTPLQIQPQRTIFNYRASRNGTYYGNIMVVCRNDNTKCVPQFIGRVWDYCGRQPTNQPTNLTFHGLAWLGLPRLASACLGLPLVSSSPLFHLFGWFQLFGSESQLRCTHNRTSKTNVVYGMFGFDMELH